MYYELRLRVKTAILGDCWDGAKKVHRFPRENGAWDLHTKTQHEWCGLLEHAIAALDLDVDPDTIRWPSSIELPTLHLHEVSYRLRHEKGQTRKKYHEAIPRNAILTLSLLVRETDGRFALKAPTQDELHRITGFIGSYEGISLYGSGYGFGRFAVESIRPVGRCAFDLGELSERSLETADFPGQEFATGGVGTEERAGDG